MFHLQYVKSKNKPTSKKNFLRRTCLWNPFVDVNLLQLHGLHFPALIFLSKHIIFKTSYTKAAVKSSHRPLYLSSPQHSRASFRTFNCSIFTYQCHLKYLNEYLKSRVSRFTQLQLLNSVQFP